MPFDPLHVKIQSILFEQWDPIGIRQTDAPRDEYNLYLSDIVRLIRERVALNELAAHLLEIERREMGLAGDAARAARVAAALTASLPR